ncbi:MAG: hypothetical protein AB8I08_14945 [Sandaracinaceae bacterium]
MPATDGDASHQIRIFATAEESPVIPGTLTAAGPGFYFDTDLPAGTAMRVRLPLREGIAPEDVFIGGYGGVRPAASGGPVGYGSGIVPSTQVEGWLEFDTLEEDRLQRLYFEDHDANEVAVRGGVQVIYLINGSVPTPRAVARERARRLLDELVGAREALDALGCAMPPTQVLIARDLPDSIAGLMWPGAHPQSLEARPALLIEVEKRMFDRERPTRSTVAHETFHTAQYWRYAARSVPDAWWVEASAMYVEDEIYDDNDFLNYPANAFDRSVSRYGLDFVNDRHEYGLIAFFKALKAQQGSFNACRFLDQVYQEGDSVDALSTLLGGEEPFLRSYERFASAYNFIRSSTVLDDGDVWFDASEAEFARVVSSRSDSAADYVWSTSSAQPPGAESARFVALEGERDLQVEVGSPDSGFLAGVYDASHTRVGELTPEAPLLDLPHVSGDFYITVARAQRPMLTGDGRIEVTVTESTDLCSINEGRPGDPNLCSGSGESFDDECCAGEVCVVGRCRTPRGRRIGREQALCSSQSDCLTGLACRPTENTEQTVCCADSDDYCEADADCCGQQTCVAQACVARTLGESCRTADCESPYLCQDDVCS